MKAEMSRRAGVVEELCVVKMLYWDSYRIKLPLECPRITRSPSTDQSYTVEELLFQSTMFSLRLIVRMGKLISLVPRFYKISVSSRFGVNNRFRRDKNGIIVSAGHLLKTLKFAEKENTYQEFSLEAIIDHPSKLTF